MRKTIPRRTAEKSLKQKGFIEDRNGDHIYFRHAIGGKITGPYAKISHTPKHKDISGDLLKNIKNQLKLDRMEEAFELLDCTMNGDRYNCILVGKSIIHK